MDITKPIIISELTEASKGYTKEELNSFYQWMMVEYANHMMLSREKALNTLQMLKNNYSGYTSLVKVLEKHINDYASLKSYYFASIDLLNR